MGRVFTFLTALIFVFATGSIAFAQSTRTIDFEPNGVGADWNWTVSEDADNPPLEFVANPANTGINTSSTVAKFITRQSGQPYALFFTDDVGQFTFDANNSTVKIMVYKSVKSPVHIKFEGLGNTIELTDSNTVTNQWQELTFDFSSQIGKSFNRLVVIPDFLARAQDNTIYIDNVQVPDGQVMDLSQPTDLPPAPTASVGNVISIFSNTYPSLQGVNLNPIWGQSTAVSYLKIQSDSVMKYDNLNYQGIELNQNLNLDSAGMQYLHVDFWNANSSELNVFLITPGPQQQSVALIPPASTEKWESVDIPLTQFQPTVDLSNIFQMMFTGGGTVYLDNIYFWNAVVPVELTSFTAEVNNNEVQLNWKTATETNNKGFQIERKSNHDGQYETIGFVPGSGTSTKPLAYTYSDLNLTPGTYYYRLKQIDFDGTYKYSAPVEINVSAPNTYSLNQNYPNPFNPSTKITFSLASNANVTLKIFNALGQEVTTLFNQKLSAGVHTYDFNASGFNSGIYFYKIEAEGNNGSHFVSVKKMILLK